MDTTLTFIDIVIVAAVLLPIVALNYIGKSTKRKLYKQFKALAKKNGLSITNKEFWANSYIGIDNKNKVLLFVQKEENSLTSELIDLKKIEDCRVLTSVKSIKTNKTKQNILQKVDVELYFAKNKGPVKLLSFYDHERNYSENFEVLRAEKWKNLLNCG